MHQADMGLSPALPFSGCSEAIHLSKSQFAHLKNRNKNNTYVSVRVQSKAQEPLYIFQVKGN